MDKWKVFLWLLVLNLALVFVVDAGPWKAARGAAQNNIGYLYWKGIYVGRDRGSAERFFRDAVRNGSPQAANNLAQLYEEGGAISAGREEIKELYTIAATAGIALAQNNLGVLLAEEDPAAAIVWLERAAASRDAQTAAAAEESLRALKSGRAGTVASPRGVRSPALPPPPSR